jgi:hypothetical protein
MVVNRGKIDTGLANDLAEGSGGVAVLGEEPFGSIEDLLLGGPKMVHTTD